MADGGLVPSQGETVCSETWWPMRIHFRQTRALLPLEKPTETRPSCPQVIAALLWDSQFNGALLFMMQETVNDKEDAIHYLGFH